MSKNRTKVNPWTSALVAAGVVSAASVAQAEEAINPVMTALSSTTISGYVDTSAIWMPGSAASNLPGRSYDSSGKQNGINLNVVKLTIEKPIDENSWGAGYNVGLLFGPDANALGATSTFGNFSDFAIKNAYVALRAPVGNGINFKVGVWDTVIGYEVFEAGNNPNYSRSYGFFLEPIIHTGILASYDINEILSVSAGIADNGIGSNAINSRANNNGGMAYVGNATVTAPESAGFLEGASLAGGVVYTPSLTGGADQPIWNAYVGGSMPLPITGLSAGVAYDYRGGENSGWAGAIAGYVVWQATEKMSVAGRVEYASGTAGTYTGFGTTSEEFLGVTATLDYALWANTITRFEFRWDNDMTGGTGAFGGGAENALSLALNAIYQF